MSEDEPQKSEHTGIKRITPNEIPNYDFCPVDKDILQTIIEKSSDGKLLDLRILADVLSWDV